MPNGITREVLERDGIRHAMSQRHPEVALNSDDAIRASMQRMLATRPAPVDPTDGVWLFAYGSLLWNPCVPVAERRMARLYGFHRDFQLKLTYARGSPEAPGMMLGIVPGGSCRGVALRVIGDDLEHELLMVWRREMLTGVYKPRWVELRPDDGGPRLWSIAFVVDPAHPCYCGRLDDDDVVALLATGHGMIGASAEYLHNTVGHLDEQGIVDRRLRALQQRVCDWPGAR
ncbi:ChaC-like protein [Salinisphaera sp. T31B1]